MPDDAGETVARCQLTGKAALQSFRSLKGVERMRIYFTQQDANHLLVFVFYGRHGARKCRCVGAAAAYG